MKDCFARFILIAALASGMVGIHAKATIVFTNNFGGALPSEIEPGTAVPTGVQEYEGLGAVRNQFRGSFLPRPTGNIVTLALSNLPPHTVLNISMLFAAIDSLEGTGTFPSGNFLKMTLDTNTVFRESFANATPDQIQSYAPPPGALLVTATDFTAEYTESCGVENKFYQVMVVP